MMPARRRRLPGGRAGGPRTAAIGLAVTAGTSADDVYPMDREEARMVAPFRHPPAHRFLRIDICV